LRQLLVISLLGLTACASTSASSHRVAEQESGRRTDARATASANRLSIRFPSLALENAGCAYTDTAEGVVRRNYQWHATSQFPGVANGSNHFMGIYIYFKLPESAPLTGERLDSALTSLTLRVDEAGGEPPMNMRSVHPRSARASWNGRQVVLRLDDPAAIEAFLSTGNEIIDLGWCQRDESLPHTQVRLE
jgi:hypothetical protein